MASKYTIFKFTVYTYKVYICRSFYKVYLTESIGKWLFNILHVCEIIHKLSKEPFDTFSKYSYLGVFQDVLSVKT